MYDDLLGKKDVDVEQCPKGLWRMKNLVKDEAVPPCKDPKADLDLQACAECTADCMYKYI